MTLTPIAERLAVELSQPVKILNLFLQMCFHTLNPVLFARIDGH